MDKQKIELMKELLNRYEQLDQLEIVGCTKSSRQILELYIRKLEIKLKEKL